MKIAILGAGYVGLNTAAAFAWLGHDVRVIDEDRQRTAESMRQPLLVDARSFWGADVAGKGGHGMWGWDMAPPASLPRFGKLLCGHVMDRWV